MTIKGRRFIIKIEMTRIDVHDNDISFGTKLAFGQLGLIVFDINNEAEHW